MSGAFRETYGRNPFVINVLMSNCNKIKTVAVEPWLLLT